MAPPSSLRLMALLASLAGCCLGTSGAGGAASTSSGVASTSTSSSGSGTGIATGTTSTSGTFETGTTSGGIGPGCVIAGIAYPSRAHDPTNAARCCNPAIDSTNWVPIFARKAAFPISGTDVSGPNDGAVGDINGDGIADVALTAYQGSNLQAQVWVYLSEPDGGFSGPLIEQSERPGEVWPGGVAIADINGDHRPDIIASTQSSIDVFLNLGSGFGSEIVTTTPSECGGAYLRPADVNGDGWTDVVAITESCGVKVFLNDALGDGVLLTPSSSFAAKYQADGAIGDFDGHGRPNLAFGAQSGGLAWLPNSGADLGPEPLSVSGTQSYTVYGMVGFPLGNGSGLAVASNALLEIFSPTDAGPQFGSSYLLDVATGDVVTADLNGDGLPDLVVASGWGTGSSIDILLGEGSGFFGAAAKLELGTSFQLVGLGDIDGDGAPDLVVFGGGWETWVNQCGP